MFVGEGVNVERWAYFQYVGTGPAGRDLGSKAGEKGDAAADAVDGEDGDEALAVTD